MEPLDHILPNLHDPPLVMSLAKRSERVPKGSYSFTEQYCTDPADDCRGVTIVVLNEKLQQKAVIPFGFDQDNPFAGPYLDPASKQAPYAQGLLQLFVDTLNRDPKWLDQFYRHYKEVRKEVAGKPYRGKPFPKPGTLEYRVMPPPDLQAQIEKSLRTLGKSGAAAPPSPRLGATTSAPAAAGQGGEALLSRYLELGTSGATDELLSLQSGVRDLILREEGAEQELARLLPELFQHSPQEDERIEAALRLLYDALQILQFELPPTEAGGERMARLQNALAQHVFQQNEDVDLRVAVSNTIVQSRVEILPVLREASSRMMIAAAGRSDLQDVAGEEIMSGILRSLHALGVSSPFEGTDELLQLFLLNDAELQTALIAEMMQGDEPLLQEIAALMLFHGDPKVRLGVSELLVETGGGKISPQTLRRLIISRNWFPEELRKNVDRAIAGARKARVECAPLPRPQAIAVYATPPDDSGMQTFNLAIEQGESFWKATVVVREGIGVVDAAVAPLKGKRELSRFQDQLKSEPGFSASSLELLDLRLCSALHEGGSTGHLPNHWLLRCAELVGRGNWRPIVFDPARELLQMREDLEAGPGKGAETDLCLEDGDSASWRDQHPFLSKWVADAEAVGRELNEWRRTGHQLSADLAIELVADVVMEKSRSFWLERLVWTALWLKGAKKPPLPWQKMYQLTQAVADETVPLKEIPLMRAIAAASAASYLRD